MAYEKLFDTEENMALIAICTRKLISNIGVGAIIWGVINTVFGVVAMQVSFINIGLVILGVMMLGAGIKAIKSPTLGVLLAETVVAVLLFLWNLGISILNFHEVGRIRAVGRSGGGCGLTA